MKLVVLLKAGMVGGFGFVIAIGVVMTLLIPAFKSLQETPCKVNKLPSLIIFLIVLAVEFGFAYWYFSSTPEVSSPSEMDKFTMYACLFSLTPSIAIVVGALFYYLDVQKALKNKGL